MATAETVIQLLLVGLLQGGVYALISIGLTIIFGVLGIINFAQAEFLMVGMFTTVFLHSYFGIHPVVLAFVLLPLGYVAGMLVYKVLINKIVDKDGDQQLLVTFGLLLIIQFTAFGLWGPGSRRLDTPYASSSVALGPFGLNEAKLIAFVFSLAMALATILFIRYTELGRAIRATASNPTVAEYAGIPKEKMYQIAFSLGIALTFCAGAVIVMYHPVNPATGFDFIIIMFVVIVMGGLGSIKGAVVAGLLIGIIEQLTTFVLPLQAQSSIAFVLFLIIVLVRPQGLFGSRSEA